MLATQLQRALSLAADMAAKRELIDTLAAWLDPSDATRLVYTTYGGVGWLTVDTPLGTMTINADTRRDAIESLVDAGGSASGLRLKVVANRRGRINKVTFDNFRTHGWSAYVVGRRGLNPLRGDEVLADERTGVGCRVASCLGGSTRFRSSRSRS